MNATAIAQLLNLAFTAISTFRHLVGTNEQINARLALVDAGGEAITVDEVQSAIDSAQAEINRGREL